MAADHRGARPNAAAGPDRGPPGRPTMPVAGGGSSGAVKRQGVGVGGGGRRAAAASAQRSTEQSDRADGDLVVGEGVRVTGRITACDRLVVAGRVEAELPAGSLEVREGGVFYGEARVQGALIAGVFDGTLIVSGALVLTETAQVRGQVRYATLEIAAGGELRGDVDRVDTASAEAAAEAPAERGEPERPVAKA